MEFSEKVVLVTGAGKGLGREIALAFAAQGAVVAANDLTPVNLDKTLALMRAQGGRAQEYLFDIAKALPARALVEQVVADYGRIDILVHNAAVAPRAALLEMDEWDWLRTLDVNLSGAFYLMQAAGRVMRRQGGGVMVTLGASWDYLDGAEQMAAFHASKAGLVGLTQAAARVLAPYHIRVNAVCPGELAAQEEPLSPGSLLPAQPAQSGISARDVAALVLFLCSDAARHISGQAIEIGSPPHP